MTEVPFDPFDLIRDEGTGSCHVCGAEAAAQCDDCQGWLCPDHLVIEAQAWDVHGWDGVDSRCPDHRRINFETRDLLRGQYLPVPIRD